MISDEMIERAAKAIDDVQLFTRFNDWTSDRVEGFPVEVCRHGDISKDEIIVVERHPAGWKDLHSVVRRERARAVLALARPIIERETLERAAKMVEVLYGTGCRFHPREEDRIRQDACLEAAAAIRAIKVG